MKDVLKQLGFTESQIAELEKEDAKIDDNVTAWKADHEAVVAANLRKDIEAEVKKEVNAAALKATTESIKTKLTRELGLSIPNVRGMELDEYITAVKKAVDEVKSNTEEAKKLQEANAKLVEAMDAVEDLKSKLSAKDKEVETAISIERSKMIADDHLAKFFAGNEWGVGKELVEFTMENLKAKVHGELSVGSDGTIKTKDGAPVIKDNSVVKTLADYLGTEVDRLNLRKKNDGRQHQRESVTGDPDKKVNPAVSSYVEQARAELGV